MANIFDVMSTINGQLNLLIDYYDRRSKSSIRRLPDVPTFVVNSIDRHIRTYEHVIYDKTESVVPELCLMSDTGDTFNPVYICVTSNINYPIIDKVSIYASHKDESGMGIGYVLAVPKIIFIEDYVSVYDLSDVFMRIYFGILSLDPEMIHKPSIGLIKFSTDPRLSINSYELEMAYVAIGCANINMKKWIGSSVKNIEESTLEAFSDDSNLDQDLKEKICSVIKKYASNIGNLRDGLTSGDMLGDIIN